MTCPKTYSQERWAGFKSRSSYTRTRLVPGCPNLVGAKEQAAARASPRAHRSPPPAARPNSQKCKTRRMGSHANVYIVPSGSILTEATQVATWPWNVPSLIRRQMPGTLCAQGACQVSPLGCGKAKVICGLQLPGLVGTAARSPPGTTTPTVGPKGASSCPRQHS